MSGSVRSVGSVEGVRVGSYFMDYFMDYCKQFSC